MMNKPVELIVAMDETTGIGKAGQLPWKLSGDMKHFRHVTKTTNDPAKKNAVLMGRKTFESIPERFRPLAGRYNVVLSKTRKFMGENLVTYEDMDTALAALDDVTGVEKIIVIGGSTLYSFMATHPRLTAAHVTHVCGSYACDTFFSEVGPCLQRGSLKHELGCSEDGVFYRICTYDIT